MARRRNKSRSEKIKAKVKSLPIYKSDASYRTLQERNLRQGEAARAVNRAAAAADSQRVRQSKGTSLVKKGTAALANLDRGRAKDLAASLEGTLAGISPAFDRRQRLKGIKKAKKLGTLSKSSDVFDLPDLEEEDYTKVSMLKKGGKVKKTKGRKRAALRGYRAELRGG